MLLRSFVSSVLKAEARRCDAAADFERGTIANAGTTAEYEVRMSRASSLYREARVLRFASAFVLEM